MDTFKAIAGLLICFLSIVVGLYLGVWIMFVGGMVQIVDAVKSVPTDAMGIMLGMARFFFSGAVGWLSFMFLFAIGRAMLE